jgi:bacillithiol system protein YtxJ
MNWVKLQSPEQITDIQKESAEIPILIFKHSTSCSISRTALDRLERNWKDSQQQSRFYYLDLHAHRETSNQVARFFEVEHESPQVLIIKNGKAVFNRSHFDIEHRSIQDALQNL